MPWFLKYLRTKTKQHRGLRGKVNPSLERSVWFSLLQQDLTTKRERVKARTAREVVHLKIIKMLIKKKKDI